MPRPPLYYKANKTTPSVMLEEIKFWLAILQEHTVFIRAGIPAEHTDLINEAKNFYQELGALRARADKPLTEKKFTELVKDALAVITDLYKFKRHLLHLSMTGRLEGCNPPLFYDHLAREAEYVLRLLEESKKYGPDCRTMSKAQEAAFWLQLMADHGRFIGQRLDPSERNLVGTAISFADEFDQLRLQSTDFVSMMRGYNRELPAFDRFLQDARMATIRLRDFERAVVTMIEERRLLGTMPVLLAEHVRREADHFLVIQARLVKGLKNYVEDDAIDTGIDLAANEVSTTFAENHCLVCAPDMGATPTNLSDRDDDDEDLDDDDEEPARPPFTGGR